MKTQITITICVLIFCIAVFFGLSNVTVSQTQYQSQTQTQQQIQRNDNIQLTIIDTSKKVNDISWEYMNFKNVGDVEYFMNTELDFFQARESKLSAADGDIWLYTLIYPVLETEIKSYTNSSTNENYNTNKNEIKIDILGKLKAVAKGK